ncbi:MAG: hypothetical protein ACJAS1_002150 [Oleiphilaceae bacterium]|jgi:hypothetical protein
MFWVIFGKLQSRIREPHINFQQLMNYRSGAI